MSEELLRIGELAKRTDVSTDVLRAWERRYGVLQPQRSQGGFRLYDEGDAERVRAMRAHIAAGLAPAEAARLVLSGAMAQYGDERQSSAAGRGDALAHALDRFDEAGAQRAFDTLTATLSPETVLRDVVLPHLRELGERWQRGDASIAQEHFASSVLRGRLLGLARGWDAGAGPRALLCCPPGERHDLGLVCFGLALRNRGWRITLLGSDTPAAEIASLADMLAPRATVVAAMRPEPLAGIAVELADMATRHALYLAGTGADADLAHRCAATLLSGDPIDSASELAASS